jgi:hypothetical protein
MIRTLNLTFFFIVTISVFGQESDEELVRKSFASYSKSLLNSNEDDVIKFVDSRTIKYYSDILDLVKNADSTRIEELPLMDKMMVLSIRCRVSKEDILSFNGEKLLIHALNIGMINKTGLANLSNGNVTIENDFAKGQLIGRGQELPHFFHFYKEGQWKIDLTSAFPIAFPVLQKLADEMGGANKFILASLKLITGKSPDHEIWNSVR